MKKYFEITNRQFCVMILIEKNYQFFLNACKKFLIEKRRKGKNP
ncbi:hypothetical protein HMPREF1987_02195 [Peptostreptococcaceae bacterium oral taxon 113 str. W5053]|nr:hypothetical protein HMPREF1987_02195 [Peptostreptococcaceae bacterium oral taxon 113 str. W5053]